jgi:iron complex outermembrane recepter protein
MTARALTWLLMAGTLGVYPNAVFAQQPAPVPASPPVQATPAEPGPPVTPPPAVAPTPPAAPIQATPPAPVTTPAPVVPAPAVAPPALAVPTVPAPPGVPVQQQNGQAPAQPGIAVPEVQVIQPEPVKPKVVVPQQAAAPKQRPVQAATPAPAPQPAAKPAPVVPTPVAAPQTVPVAQAVEPGSQVKLAPAGGEIAIEKYAGSVSTVSAANIASSGSNNTTDALQQRVAGVIVTDANGNSFQQEVNYRGFSSSAVNGSPQGLAVYQNGVRINEVYGDTVNWDMIPSVAISDIAVISGNPVYGLNAIGGAVTITMKDGFNYQGTEIDARAGSFGRRQASIQSGAKSGNLASYFAVEAVKDDGWRDQATSTVRRAYGDLGYRDERGEYHFNVTGASNKFGAAAATPIELVNQRYGSVFTTPQTSENQMVMLSFNGAYALTKTTKLSGNIYHRKFKNKRVDGNVSDVADCDPALDPALAGLLCFGEPDNPLNFPPGIPSLGLPIYGSIDRSSVDADGFGGSVQVVEKSKLFGLGNQLLVGASIDMGRLTTKSSSELGVIDPTTFVVSGLGITLTDAGVAGAGDNVDSIKPVDLGVRTNYYGFYISDTVDVTDKFAVTLGGRYNIAEITLRDQGGISPELDGNSRFQRFNPVVGGAYKLAPNATLYGGYSEANRAPTPTELACSDPLRPCLLENFLSADPPLKQVVSHTFEGGLRGFFHVPATSGKLDWSIGLYRAENDDDIISVASAQQGRGYFQNAGTTRRQGVDLSVGYKDGRFSFYSGYGYVDATFQSNLELPSANNPGAATTPCAGDPATNCVLVTPGNKIAAVPAHRFKAGFEYFLTDKWLFGADLVAASDQFFRGDENNANPKLPGYATVNLHTSYDVSKNVQVYGLVNNVFDNKYYLFGTYYNSGDLSTITGQTFSDNRTVVPGAPLAAYGGVKIKF